MIFSVVIAITMSLLTIQAIGHTMTNCRHYKRMDTDIRYLKHLESGGKSPLSGLWWPGKKYPFEDPNP